MTQTEAHQAAAPPPPPPRLSVAMIARDEAATLGAALASVAGLADEVIVVDTGSTDGTAEIAAAAGAKVVHAPWGDDFAAARNVALSHCTGDWVLSLDADEVLTPESADALRALLAAQPAEPAHGYRVRIVNWRDSQRLEATEHLAPRLFPCRETLRYAGRIHESLQPGDGSPWAWHVAEGVVLHHSGYQRDSAAFAAKTARNLALLRQALDEAPDDPYLHFHHGIALQVAGRRQDAFDSYRRVTELCAGRDMPPEYLPYAWIYQLGILNDDGQSAAVLTLAESCKALCQDEPDYWLNLGIAHSDLGQWPQAIEAFGRCLEPAAGRRPLIADAGATTWKPLLGIGAAHLKLDNREQAEQFLRRLVALQPRHRGALEALVQLSLDRQDLIRAELDMRQLLESCQDAERAHIYRELTRFLLSINRPHAAVELYEQLIQEAPYPARTQCLIDLAAMLQEARLTHRVLPLLVAYRLRPGVAEILAHHYTAANDHAALVSLCDDLLAAGQGQAFAYGYRGLARYHLGDFTGAVDDLRRATDETPDFVNLWALLGNAYLAIGQVEAAETSLAQALNLQADHLPARLALVEVALERLQVVEAARLLNEAMAGQNGQTLRAAATAIDKLLKRCDHLFTESFLRPGAIDPMVVSRMIDRLQAAAKA